MKQAVLLVDDNVKILSSMKRALRKSDFDLSTFQNPLSALKEIDKEDFSVVIADYQMADLDGINFLKRVDKIRPDTIKVLLTGNDDMSIAVNAINEGVVFRFIKKPWNNYELQSLLKQCYDQYQMQNEIKRLHEITKVQNKKLIDLNKNLDKKIKEKTKEKEQLNESLKDSLIGAINLISDLTESHCAHITNHTKRVSELSKEIAKRMGLPSADIFKAGIAGLVHDIGKISLNQELLRKPLKSLSKHERETIYSHSVYGEKILSKLPYLKDIAVIIRHQSENFSGNGFPDKLTADKTPLISRIIKLANHYDELLNLSWSVKNKRHEEVMEKIKDQTPELFDPVLVDVLDNISKDMSSLESSVIEIRVRDLVSGMECTRDVKTISGVLLLSSGSVFSDEIIQRIRKYQKSDPIIESIQVKKNV